MSEPQGRRFHLLERIGAGAFGEVYLAEQDSGAGFRKRVAIKLLHAHHDGFELAHQRMRDEARILGRLTHRHIVTVLDLVRLDNRWAVIMDYVPGADLEMVIEALERNERMFSPVAALEVGSAVCNALDVAFKADDGNGEQLGVVHRDIKPANIRITDDGETKVLDFGVARVNMATRESATGMRMGTERYMSPERIIGDPEGPPGDVYATIATIVELINRKPLGRTPVVEDRHTPFVDEALVEVKIHLKGPEEAIEATLDLLRRGLHVDPEQRPAAADASDELARLARLLEGPSLREFCRDFVPEVAETLGTRTEKVDGVLSESILTEWERDAGSATLSEFTEPAAVVRTAASTGGSSLGTAGGNTAQNAQQQTAMRALAFIVPMLLVVGLLFAAALGGLGAVAILSPAEPTGPAATDDTEDPVDDTEEPVEDTEDPVDDTEESVDDTEEPGEDTDEGMATDATTDADDPEAPDTDGGSDVEVPEKPPNPGTGTVSKPSVDPNAPRISRAMVVMSDASALSVTCGDVSKGGSSSARIKDFPAGTCTVTATYLGQSLNTQVKIDRATTVECVAEGDKLSCR